MAQTNPGNKCALLHCNKYAAKWLCGNHLKEAQGGRIPLRDEWGITLNLECMLEGCENPRRYRRSESYCIRHEHQKHADPDRPVGERRSKLLNGQQGGCRKEGCTEQARSKHFCATHYVQSKSPQKTECSIDGCGRLCASDMCGSHASRLTRYGFIPDGENDPRLIQMYRDRGWNCSVGGCQRVYRSEGSLICPEHGKSRRRLGMTVELFLEVMSVEECQSCGRNDVRLVLDHRHGHHGEDQERMCSGCFRGRICNACNTALGYLGDSATRIEALLNYAIAHEGDDRLY